MLFVHLFAALDGQISSVLYPRIENDFTLTQSVLIHVLCAAARYELFIIHLCIRSKLDASHWKTHAFAQRGYEFMYLRLRVLFPK